MRLLLDTHAFAWWMLDDPRMSNGARAAIESQGVTTSVSVCSVWEIAIKVGVGKWPEASDLLSNLEDELAGQGFALLPIQVAHVRMAGLMTSLHRDTFDRLLAAQAVIEGLTLVTSDMRLAGLGPSTLW